MCSSTGSNSAKPQDVQKVNAQLKNNSGGGLLSHVLYLPEYQKLQQRRQRAMSLSNTDNTGGVMK